MKAQIIKSIKIAVTVAISIWIASLLGLKYPVTAGIITILSIGSTKKETIKVACKRGAAFICALALAFACFGIMGYSIWSFSVYVLIFSFICIVGRCSEAIAMDSVLISHFLAEQNMGGELVLNEILLFCLGVGMGILVNMHLHRHGDRFDMLANEVDEQIKGILHRMSLWIPVEDKSEYNADCFKKLDRSIKAAHECAAANYNNSLLDKDTSELEYIKMREKQSIILKEIYTNIKSLSTILQQDECLPRQATIVAQLFDEIEKDYHKNNTVAGLLEKLDGLLADMKTQELPSSRTEFEVRAVLFYILMQTRALLELKREYVLENNYYY